MANDLQKWTGPATGGELAEAIVETRLAMIELHKMIVASKGGNQQVFTQAQQKYLDVDEKLMKLANRVGGLDGPK